MIDKGPVLHTSAFESLYGGQLTLTTQLTQPNFWNEMKDREITALININLKDRDITALININ